MKTRGMRLAGMMAVLSLMVLGLLGCSVMGEPSSAEDLLVRYAANPDNTNCVANLDVELGLTVSGYRTLIPVEADVRMADSTAAGHIGIDLSDLEAGVREYDVYAELQDTTLRVYARPAGSDAAVWDRTELDATFSIDIPLVVELLSDAKFMRVAYDSDDQVRYELTLPAKTLVMSLLDKGEITTSFWEVDRDALADAIKDSKLHVRFNEDCLVRSLSLDLNFAYVDKELAPSPIKVSLDAEAVMDGYGTVKAPDAAIPDQVKADSELTDDPLRASEMAEQIMDSML